MNYVIDQQWWVTHERMHYFWFKWKLPCFLIYISKKVQQRDDVAWNESILCTIDELKLVAMNQWIIFAEQTESMTLMVTMLCIHDHHNQS